MRFLWPRPPIGERFWLLALVICACGCEIRVEQPAIQPRRPVQVSRAQAEQIGKGIPADRPRSADVPEKKENPAGRLLPAKDESSPAEAKAIRQIEREIRDALKLRKTLVVLLLDDADQVDSLRKAVGRQMVGLLREVDTTDTGRLQVGAVAYGDSVRLLTADPLTDAAKLQSRLDEIAGDSKGQVLGGVSDVFQKYLPYRAQNHEVVFVIMGLAAPKGLEDESIAVLKRSVASVFGLGPAAPFGTRPPTDDQPSRRRRRPIDPVGPLPIESRWPERIGLAPPSGENMDDLADAGYGPFELERLCRLTGGRFFRLRPASEPGWSIDPDTGDVRADLLAEYTPDYGTQEQYKQLLAENKCRMALHQAAQLPAARRLENARLEFPKEADEAAMVRTLTVAQRAAAEAEQPIQKLYDALAAGEPDRARLTGARWQAGYDLAMGQVLSAKAQVEGYNAMLATLKLGKRFAKPDSSRWVLEPADEIAASSPLDKMAKSSREYLQRVAREHQGTPWAMAAERELRHPAGWKLSEE